MVLLLGLWRRTGRAEEVIGASALAQDLTRNDGTRPNMKQAILQGMGKRRHLGAVVD